MADDDQQQQERPAEQGTEDTETAAAAAVSPPLSRKHKILYLIILGQLACVTSFTIFILHLQRRVGQARQRRAQEARKSMSRRNNSHNASKTIHPSSPSLRSQLHTHRTRHADYQNIGQVYWNRAASLLLADWDPTVATISNDNGAIMTTSKRNATCLGLDALIRSAEAGHADAQYVLANAYASGMWPVTSECNPLHEEYQTTINQTRLTVQETWVDPTSHQQQKAWILWQMAAIGGHAEASMTLAHRQVLLSSTASSSKHHNTDCQRQLPYYHAAASVIMDELETDLHSRGKVTPSMDKHMLYQVHLFGDKSKLDPHNKPDESQDALQYYHVRAMDSTNAASASAAYTLAHLYHYGLRGVPQNLTKSLHYYELAANMGHWEAAGQAGELYLWGIGTQQDPYQAYKYFQMGMPVGLDGCRRKLELKLKEGSKKKDGTEEKIYLCDSNCLNGMGLLRLLGLPLVVERNVESAMAHIQLAKEQGNKDASYNLAMMKLGWKTHFRSLDELVELDKDGQSSAKDAKTVFPATTDDAEVPYLTQPDVQSVLTDLTSAAGSNHIQAKYRLASMYATGVKAPNRGHMLQVVRQDCDRALKNFKWIVENASPQRAKRLRKAYKQYMAGDTAGSLRNYLAAAEAGSDLAQLNAAFLLEQGECLSLNRVDCARASVRLWKAAADKGNAEASLRVGDFYYYGRLRESHEGVVGPFGWVQYVLYPERFLPKLWSYLRSLLDEVMKDYTSESEPPSQQCAVENADGTCEASFEDADSAASTESHEVHSLQRDLEMAAQYYRIAAERSASSPRANFNLAFLYEWGLGVKQDFHLAKRHYDLAVAGHGVHEAGLPVTIALVGLSLHMNALKLFISMEEWWKGYSQSKMADKEVGDDDDLAPSVAESSTAGRPVPGGIRPRTKTDVFLEHLLTWESLVILILTIILSILLRHRRTRR